MGGRVALGSWLGLATRSLRGPAGAEAIPGTPSGVGGIASGASRPRNDSGESPEPVPISRRQRGAVLLEVLIALTVLATAGSALVTLLDRAVAAQVAARESERRIESADRLLTALSLLSRADLEQRIGVHRVGEFIVRVERPEPTLFRVAIAAAETPLEAMLVTVVYRAPVEVGATSSPILSTSRASARPSLSPSARLSIPPSAHLSVRPSARLSVRPSVRFS